MWLCPSRSKAVAEWKISAISAPKAPAFIRKAPPTVPGMPRMNSSPESEAASALWATATSVAPAPVVIRSSSIFMFPKGFPSLMTTPLTPPSRTSKFEPTPITVSGTLAPRFFRNDCKSASSLGRNKTSAGPPVRNQIRFAKAASSKYWPLTFGRVSRRVISLASIIMPPPFAPFSRAGRWPRR